MPDTYSSQNPDHSRPIDVGILALEIYFPYLYVDQKSLEKFDNVSEGKYTIGLGQQEMGFCQDNEDINSLCLTVVSKLMEKHKVDYKDIGRLEVGTETIIDKSKSVKSVLMSLFEDSGNFDVEGIDTTNACYGGTSALFNAVSWVESSAWDGRYAVVVCGDIAVYASGNARCTGGAGAVAMLVGPSAPLVVEPGLRGTYMRHAYDFYKPDLSSEYPVVDGKLSVESFITALDSCYEVYCRKAKLKGDLEISLKDFDFMIFHSPFTKLVQKSLARLVLNDFVRGTSHHYLNGAVNLTKYKNTTLHESIFDKNLEKIFMKASEQIFKDKTSSSLLLARRVGNMYTPSLYSCLVSLLVSTSARNLNDKRIGLFSYGSGLASSMFSIRVKDGEKFTLENLTARLHDVTSRLDSRKCLDPAEFTSVLNRRAATHTHANHTPQATAEHLFPRTYYLTHVDDKFRRTYQRKPADDVNGNTNGHCGVTNGF